MYMSTAYHINGPREIKSTKWGERNESIGTLAKFAL